MTAGRPYRLAPGMRLQRDASGAAVLLVPEGIVNLNDTAAAILALTDGTRDVDEIVHVLSERFSASHDALSADVRELLNAFVARGFVIV